MEKGTVVSPNTKIDAFQGLRTAALAGIIFYHYNNPGLSTYAAWSVSLFFMLSGYLNGLSWTKGKHPHPKYYWGFNGVSWFLSSYAVICLLTPVLLHKTARFLENKKFKTVAKTIFVIVTLQFCYSETEKRTRRLPDSVKKFV